MFLHWVPLYVLSGVQGWHIAGAHFFFFLKKIFVFKPEVYLLLMNKPSFPASSHALLLYEPISWFTCWPGELALPSLACFLGSIALQCPCPSFQFVQVPSAFKVNPLA